MCLSKQTPPEVPFEIAVDVKVEESDGAAGLVFHSDSGDIHYGFYPSSGGLRLSRFDGPTVYSWNVLHDVRSEHFRPETWNRLKVRIEEDLISCYCNDELIIEHRSPRLTKGRIGIVKFRHTTAAFKRFRFAESLPGEKADKATWNRVARLVGDFDPLRPPTRETVTEFANLDAGGLNALQEQADQLEKKAAQLRILAREIREEQVRERLVKVLNEDGSANLLSAALLVASLDNQDLDIDAYTELMDHLAEEFSSSLQQELSLKEKLKRFHNFLFEEQAFHGSRTNYYHASNSYINEVIDDREGLPLTLSIVYVELARRVGIPAEGIGLPGHFIVRVTADESWVYLDVFDAGKEWSLVDCQRHVLELTGQPWDDRFLEPQTPNIIILRMLRNLIRVANDEKDLEAALRYTRTILAIDPDSVHDRLFKAVVCFNTDRIDEGEQEVEWVLREQPEGIDLRRVRELQDAFLNRRQR